MRIAYVVTRADAVGGATIHVMEMARAARARGYKAEIFTGGRGAASDKLAESGAAVHSLRFLRRAPRPFRDLRALAELTAALRQYGPDLISAHTAKAGWLGRVAGARLGIPAIYTPHGLPLGGRTRGWGGWLLGAAERVAGRWARAIVCVAEAERRLALARGLAKPERLVVIYNGVRDIPEGLRADPAVSPPRVVSVARFEPPKDPATLLRALARLQGIEWELDLVGDGPLESASRALAARLEIAGRVRFLGYRPDVAPALARGQVFALATRSESFPRSVLEAMRAGLPAAVSDVGGVAEAVEPGRSGFLVPPGEEQALAAALGELLANAPLRRRLGSAARQIYESRFKLEHMIAPTLALYDAVLRGDLR